MISHNMVMIAQIVLSIVTLGALYSTFRFNKLWAKIMISILAFFVLLSWIQIDLLISVEIYGNILGIFVSSIFVLKDREIPIIERVFFLLAGGILFTSYFTTSMSVDIANLVRVVTILPTIVFIFQYLFIGFRLMYFTGIYILLVTYCTLRFVSIFSTPHAYIFTSN